MSFFDRQIIQETLLISGHNGTVAERVLVVAIEDKYADHRAGELGSKYGEATRAQTDAGDIG
jgi:hypothetical protein